MLPNTSAAPSLSSKSPKFLSPLSLCTMLCISRPSSNHCPSSKEPMQIFAGRSLCTNTHGCVLRMKQNEVFQMTGPKILCAMNMTAGQSDEPWKMKLDLAKDKARKLWDSAPQPVKIFPWNRALENFIQLILDLTLSIIKYLTIPVLAVSSLSEMSYCAHEKKLQLVPIPLLIGVVIAGVLQEAALESSSHLKNAKVPWHLIAIAIFFTLLKLPGPYYPYWGRIFIPHFANGALLRTLLFAFQWYRKPPKASIAQPQILAANPC